METAPRNCRFLSLVVVELVLKFLSSPDFPEISGDSVELGRNRENSRNFGKTQGNPWNSVGFLYGVSYNFSGIPGGFRRHAGFGKIWGLGWFRAIWGLKRLLRKKPVPPAALYETTASNLQGRSRKATCLLGEESPKNLLPLFSVSSLIYYF